MDVVCKVFVTPLLHFLGVTPISYVQATILNLPHP